MAFYLITGGAGFIGSSIAEELVRRGEKVRILDNFSTGKRENLSQVEKDVDVIEADIRDLSDVKSAMKNIDYVLHQAALSSITRSVDDPIASNAVNVDGAVNLLVTAKEAGVKRFVYASSSSIYGANPALPKQENMLPDPISPYAVSKMAGERYCRAFAHVFGISTIALRYFNVFGPKQDPNSQYAAVVPKFITALIKGERPVVHGDGTQSRDFTYISNVVEANLLACHSKDGKGEMFNIACGENYSLLLLIDILNEIIGTDLKPEFTDPRTGDVKHSLADISKASQILSYRPKVDFREGLQKTVEWYLQKSE